MDAKRGRRAGRHAARIAVSLVVAALQLTWTSSAAGQERPTDQWLASPVDRATYDAYLEFYRYGTDVPFATTVSGTSTVEGVRVEALSFQSTPGQRVTAALYHPTGSRLDAAPAIIFLHGGSARGKDAAFYQGPLRFIARAGITVLAIDMPHFGERADGFFTTFDEIEKHERLYNAEAVYLDWVQQTVKDVRRSYDFLVAARGVQAARIGLAGTSRGGVLAAIAGAVETRLRAVALLHFGHFDFFEDGHLAAACPANYVGHIRPRPVFTLSADDDQDFLPDAAIRPILRLIREPKTERWTPGGHAATSDDDLAALVDWLRRQLAR
ncbi:MAG TPA: alpha/beta fold hydrolase [Gemmatimonadales bacterium]